MQRDHGFDEIIDGLPSVLERLWAEAAFGPDAVESALQDAGLPSAAGFDDGPYGRIRIPLVAAEDHAAGERRLRTAISRKVGKAVGGDKHWDIGAYEVAASAHRGVLEVRFQMKYSLAHIRAAAQDWLNGADGQSWLLEHRFIDAGAERNERGFWPKPASVTQNPTANMQEDGRVRAHLFVDPGARPPGAKAASDDEAYATTLAYLAEALGAQDDPSPFTRPVWSRGPRKFSFSRMSSRTRNAEFTETVRSGS